MENIEKTQKLDSIEKSSKIKKIALIGNIILALIQVITAVIFMQVRGALWVKYVTKSTASGLFVVAGIFNLILLYKSQEKDGLWKSIIMLVGLIFAMSGDIVLIEHFVVGAGLFAIGHIFFLIYFCLMYKFNLIDLFIFLGLVAVAMLIIFLYPNFQFDGMLPVIIVYAIVISSMLAKAIGNYFSHKTTENLITLLGAFLFFFSDMMLLFYCFAGNNIIFDYFCIYTYYPAEFMLGLTILLQYKNYPQRK